MTEHSDTPKALEGLIVLDLSRILAGPTATQLLGDLGATVLKIENPKTGGDDTRTWGPPYVQTTDGQSDLSAYFMAANRNKLSVSADLSTQEGQSLVRSIAAHADVVIENYKPGGLAKYGLDHATLRGDDPALVYCSISGFGQTGPNRDLPGYDLMAQGYGGIMSITGAADGPPMKVGVGIADVVCGMYAAVGILAALRHRDQTGEGQHIDLALVDTQMAWLINQGMNFLTSGLVPERRGNEHPNIVPYDVFAGKDGHIILAVGNDGQFKRMCQAFDREDLENDPRFLTNPDRVQNRVEISAELTGTFAKFTCTQLLETLQSVGVPCGPINTIEQALNSDQALARGNVQHVPNPQTTAGEVALLGNPLKLSATPVTFRRPPPRFGQDNATVIAMLDALKRKSDTPG